MFSSVYLIFLHHIASSITAAKQKLGYSCDRLEYSVHDKRRSQYWQQIVFRAEILHSKHGKSIPL